MPKSELRGGQQDLPTTANVGYAGQMVSDGFLACGRYHLHGIPKRPGIPMQAGK